MVVAVASPSSAPAAAAGRPHPTYKEMIVQALTELRQPSGSSRRAIAKYIADHFSGLPARHDALLSVHLRRLRSQGLLLMSGYSYLLSSSAPTAAPQQHRGRGRPPKKGNPATSAALAPPPGEKRGPGRPRKNTALAAVPVPVFGAKRGPGRPRKNAVPAASSAAPLGVKRGPGRPRKNAASPVAPARPFGVKRGPGRPRRNAAPALGAPPTAVLGMKRGRGRPPKSAPVLTPALGAPPTAVLGVKRGRGRPPKSALQGSLENAVVSTSASGARRPLKAMLLAHSGIAAPATATPSPVAGPTPMEKKRPGRPRKGKPLQPGGAALTKRGPGRPRKEKESAVAAEMTGAGGEAEPPQAESEHAEIGVAALVEKRGRGRPRKEKPSAARSAETDAALMGNKRGCGRTRKDKSFETGFAQAAGEVSRDLTEAVPEKDEDLVSGEKTKTEYVALGERKETWPADAGGVLVSGEKAATASMEAGGAMSGEKTGVDPMNSSVVKL